MLEFKRMTLDDIDHLRPYILESKTRSCDDTVADVLMWRDYFDKSYAIVGDSLVIKMKYFNQDDAFMMPLGGDAKAALEAIKEDAKDKGTLPSFVAVTKERLPELEAVFTAIESETTRDWWDYMYEADAFIAQRGKKYSSQRNHVNRFIRSYPGYHFKKIETEDLADIKAFFQTFSEDYDKDDEMVQEETVKIIEVLDNYDTYGMQGAVLKLGDMVLGFTIGEVIGDTLIVHTEKARTDIPGVYPVLSQHFAEMMQTDEIVFINREEDLGDPGLRRSKEGYNPAYMLEKYSVNVTEL